MKKANLPPDPENMNDNRAKWAGSCIRHFRKKTGSEFDDCLADLLCDLMHWSDRNGLDFEAQLRRASVYYAAETSHCIEIFVNALNQIAAGGISKQLMMQTAIDALESAPNSRAKFDPVGIPF